MGLTRDISSANVFSIKQVSKCQLVGVAATAFLLAFTPSSQAKELFEMSLEELLDVEIVTAGKKLEKVADVPASVVVISRHEIETYGYTPLEQILANVPGLYPIDDYAWTGSLNYGVRGFFSTGSFNDMIILVDGVNQKESLYDSYNLSKMAIPVEAIDRIEVVRGPWSVISSWVKTVTAEGTVLMFLGVRVESVT